MSRLPPSVLIPFLLGPIISVEAYCEVYMSESEAAAKIFPGLKFSKSEISLSPADREKISKASGENTRGDVVPVYKATSGEWVVIDRVLGKHETITYAVGIDSKSKVKSLEILEYRETYGGQVREEKWRDQFIGKDLSAPLKIDKDIKNISGATLSSVHLTGGVRRVLQTYEVIKNRT